MATCCVGAIQSWLARLICISCPNMYCFNAIYLWTFFLNFTISYIYMFSDEFCRREHLLDHARTFLYQVQVHWPTLLEALMVIFSFLLDQLHQSVLQIARFSSCFTSCLLQFCCNFDEYIIAYNMQARRVKMSFWYCHIRDSLLNVMEQLRI
jgi:hypothetical protein